MRKIITFTTCLLSTLCLIGCKSSDGIDWKSYSNDYNELIKREQFNDTYPLDITGEASKAGDVYKLVITFDNAKELIENVKIKEMSIFMVSLQKLLFSVIMKR